MTSNRPYFLRAINEWIIDNDMTPHLLVDATQEDVVVPEQYIDDGKIILNISPVAIEKAEFGNDWVLFSARFNGKQFNIELPITSIIAIYAKENGRGMVFPEEEIDATESDKPADSVADTSKADTKNPPHLTIVK